MYTLGKNEVRRASNAPCSPRAHHRLGIVPGMALLCRSSSDFTRKSHEQAYRCSDSTSAHDAVSLHTLAHQWLHDNDMVVLLSDDTQNKLQA